MAAPHYATEPLEVFDHEERIDVGCPTEYPWSSPGAEIRAMEPTPPFRFAPDTRIGGRLATKRFLDVVVASLGLVLGLPVLLIAAIAVKLDSPGPVLFRQQRIGWHGRPFTMLKLRTMIPGAEQALDAVMHLNEADGPLFKASNDPRVTRVGRVLRATSIDELPQLWNVLRGEMSLVGPRPALRREVEEWPPHLHRRLEVRPGITGPWQVSGRADCSFDDYAMHDLRYVDEWSPAGDVKILAKTVPAVIQRRGAA